MFDYFLRHVLISIDLIFFGAIDRTCQRSIAFIVFLSKWKWIRSNSPLGKYFGELTPKWNLKYVTNSICLYLLSFSNNKSKHVLFVLDKIRVFSDSNVFHACFSAKRNSRNILDKLVKFRELRNFWTFFGYFVGKNGLM